MIVRNHFKFTLFSLFLLTLSLFAFPLHANAGTTLTVFAAASMTESMNMIAEAYKKSAPDVKMDQIDIKADPKVNTKKLDLVLEGTRFNIVSNKVVMVVPKGHNPKGISDFRDAVTEKVFLIALGNSDVPVGQYSEEIYKNLGLWDKLKSMNKISYASNVKEVLSQVAAGAVDCGIVYSTDAATSKGVDVVAEAPKGSHKPITYPAAILKKAKNPEAAAAFVDFLKGPESSKIFNKIGFAVPTK